MLVNSFKPLPNFNKKSYLISKEVVLLVVCYFYFHNICKNYIYYCRLDLIYSTFLMLVISLLHDPLYKIYDPKLFFCRTSLLFNSLPNSEYPNLSTVGAFSNYSSPGKRSLLVKNSFSPSFPDGKATILLVYLPNSQRQF